MHGTRTHYNGQSKYYEANVNSVEERRIMRSLSGLIAILAAEILFLQVGKWPSNGAAWALLDSDVSSDSPLVNDTSTCYELARYSHKVPQYVPYTETYRTRAWGVFHQIKTRRNYRIEYHTVWSLERKCCAGYQQIGGTCRPHCVPSCEKGICVEPNVCVCKAGYQTSNGTTNGTRESCLPVCANGCANGTCVEPDVCSCNEDYWMDSDGFTCHPVCDEECERNHGVCLEPRVCTCSLGYRNVAGNETQVQECVPVCDRACTNGYCVAPNVCKCKDGYEADDFDPRFTCKPKCSEACTFGTCTAPETCTCDEGYRMTNANVCEPICGESCKMGDCVAPEICSCYDGYGLLGNSQYVCEPIVPICEMNCTDGTCVAPGVCICADGFFYNHTDRMCKPYCEMSCGPNGECTSPNNCTCLEGYRAIPLNGSNNIFPDFLEEPRAVCQPICDFDCVNGECTAPNVCACIAGYAPSWTRRQSLPFADNGTAHVCEPVCRIRCGTGEVCTAPEVCACSDEGYTKDRDGRCVPFCAQACPNGTCTEPNRCTCNSGFASQNGSVCEPICENGCENGDCVAPNRCACHDDFAPKTGFDGFVTECVAVCAHSNCSGHGMCVVDDEYDCECDFGWTGRNCDRPTLCVVTMAFDHGVINEITIRNDTNATIVRAHENAPYCCQCDKSLDNESLCYVVQSDEANMTSTVGCLLSADLPCYTMPHYDTSTNVAKIIWPLTVVAALIATSLTALAYTMYHRHQRKKLTTGNSTAHFVRDSFAAESLLAENVIYL